MVIVITDDDRVRRYTSISELELDGTEQFIIDGANNVVKVSGGIQTPLPPVVDLLDREKQLFLIDESAAITALSRRLHISVEDATSALNDWSTQNHGQIQKIKTELNKIRSRGR